MVGIKLQEIKETSIYTLRICAKVMSCIFIGERLLVSTFKSLSNSIYSMFIYKTAYINLILLLDQLRLV